MISFQINLFSDNIFYMFFLSPNSSPPSYLLTLCSFPVSLSLKKKSKPMVIILGFEIAASSDGGLSHAADTS